MIYVEPVMIYIKEAAELFASKHKNQLIEVYAKALENSKLPSVRDCAMSLTEVASENGVYDALVRNKIYLQRLHMHARQFYREKLIEAKNKNQQEKIYQSELEKLKVAIEKHKPVLFTKVKRSVIYDDYGSLVSDKREQIFSDFIASQKIALSYKIDWETKKRLFNHFKRSIVKYESELDFKLNDGLQELAKTGLDFEILVATALQKFGWNTLTTAATGDQGVDIVAERNAMRVAVQCKYYKGSVGNKSVQEVVAGMQYLGTERAVVITTGNYMFHPG